MAVMLLLAACSGGGNAVPGHPTSAGLGPTQSQTFTVARAGPAARVCSEASVGYATCDAWRRLDVGQAGLMRHDQPHTTPSPLASAASGGCVNPSSGYTPCDLWAAYNLNPAGGGFGQTIAVVDAFDDPNAESDLAVYRNQFGLPACTTANGCFRKLNQNGVQGNYAGADTGWSQEISLDLDMASAICPNCRLLLVEGNSNAFSDLAAAVNAAVAAGAAIVSNSYSGTETAGLVAAYGPAYDHPGVLMTVASGDGGFGGPRFPDDLNTVVSVGGTTLHSIRPRSESAWSGAGSGCSAVASSLTAQPSWQRADNRIRHACSNRAYADVSADADPNTGVDAYDSFNMGGWLVFGGTSVGSPLIAGVFALAGNASSAGPSYPYAHSQALNDVSGGSNGNCGSDLCVSKKRWDGPTGLGSPNGTGAF
ncbi:MAG: peptidase S8 [Candidatus Eremiobacter antarcticus]|nr:MAG: peptidase S8 [Candidatus Eremiobacter sp. RRmetagenome_bin22]